MDVHPIRNGIFIGIDPYPCNKKCNVYLIRLENMSSAKGLIYQQSKCYDKWRSYIRWKTRIFVALRNLPWSSVSRDASAKPTNQKTVQLSIALKSFGWSSFSPWKPPNPLLNHNLPHENPLNPLLFFSPHENGHKLGLWTLIVRSKRSAICTCAVVAGFEAAAPPRSRQKVGSWYRVFLIIFIFSNWLYIILHMIYDILYIIYYILYNIFYTIYFIMYYIIYNIYSIILYYIILCYIILHYIILYYVILCHIVLYYIISYHIM